MTAFPVFHSGTPPHKKLDEEGSMLGRKQKGWVSIIFHSDSLLSMMGEFLLIGKKMENTDWGGRFGACLNHNSIFDLKPSKKYSTTITPCAETSQAFYQLKKCISLEQSATHFARQGSHIVNGDI